MADLITVLYVDDEPGLLEIGKSFLEQSGEFFVSTVISAPAGLDLLRKENFDAIVSDYLMPGMDGIKFLIEVRKKFGQIPFILFTGRGREEVVIQAINNGVDFYLQKGGEPDAMFAELSTKINYAVSRKRSDLQNQLFARMSDEAPASIVIHDFLGNMLYANEETFRLHGYTREEFLSKNLNEIDVPDSEALIAERMDLIRNTGEADFDVKHTRKDNSIIPLHVNVKIIDWGGKEVLMSIATDLTDRKKAEKRLIESEERYRAVADFTYDWEYWITPDGEFIYVSPACERITGYTPDEFIRDPNLLITITHKNDREIVIEHLSIVNKRNEEHGIIEFRIITKEGEERWIGHECQPIFNIRNEYLGTRGSNRDITEYKRAEDALSESEEKFRTLTEFSPIAIMIFQGEKWIYSNYAGELMSGYSCEELYAMNYWDFVAPEFQQIIKERGVQRQEGENLSKSIEFSIITKEGIRKWVTLTGSMIMFKGKSAGLITVNDITDNKLAKDALQKQRDDTQSVIDSSPDFLILSDPSGMVLITNQTWANLLGTDIQSLQGRNIYDLLPEPLIESRRKFFRQVIESGRPVSFEDSSRNRIWQNSLYPVFDKSGQLISIAIYSSDITERRMTQETLLRVNQKLNVLSQLTRQDLTSQIFVLNSFLEFAKKQAKGQDAIIKNIESAEEAITKIRTITELSNDYQDMGLHPPKWQDVKMAALYGVSHITTGETRYSIDVENLEIFAVPLLEKAFQGLIENSLVHGEHVSLIRTWNTTTPDGAVIIFEDDGVGIPLEKKEKIFFHEENIRAAERGLFFVREVLDITGITIRETGEPEKGARFEIVVPDGMWRTTMGHES